MTAILLSLINSYGWQLSIVAGILIVIAVIYRNAYAAGKAAERTAALKQAAKEQEKYEKNFNAAVNHNGDERKQFADKWLRDNTGK